MASRRRRPDGVELTRGAALPAMHDPKRREEWGLPADPRKRGPYMVELNLRHPQGAAGAAAAFTDQLLPAVLGKNKPTCERITSAYFRCHLNVSEWRRLISVDEDWESGKGRPPKGLDGWVRCIYRIWPDFEVKALTDRSVMTVKADAAVRSFEARGRNIVWAIVDSGVQADHPHFGSATDLKNHRLLNSEVADLHRDFTHPSATATPAPKANIASALADPCGHGTHVAGIISGQAPDSKLAPTVAFERVYTPTSDTTHTVTLQERNHGRGDAPRVPAHLWCLVLLVERANRRWPTEAGSRCAGRAHHFLRIRREARSPARAIEEERQVRCHAPGECDRRIRG